MKTVGTKVLVTIVPKEETKNGFYMPDSHRKENSVGIVELVGPDCKTIKVGQKVIMKSDTGIEVDLSDVVASQGHTYKVIEEKDILIAY